MKSRHRKGIQKHVVNRPRNHLILYIDIKKESPIHDVMKLKENCENGRH